ncbi:low temperature requirement protein A [Kitasatospora sp. NBC_01287]|uniref:low temperature requirement protein A n=1 Tax=Kitasatospora sp. NBC_01287 TaxID=2903573 RepID=UPI00224F417A|nr:low temperature requirement protein A [Kitasatospora sp. NBC_01287]MCX4748812.1 low temperature requirement protein A [Kitasatospora sp. NBC_01287]
MADGAERDVAGRGVAERQGAEQGTAERGGDGEEVAEKRVTWAEGYFDLVFVFAITQVAGLLNAHHGAGGLLRALVVFIPLYWAWVGTTVQANVRDADTPRDRLGIFAVALSGLFMALALPEAYGGRGLLFGGAYWAARLVLLGLIVRVRGTWRGPYGIGAAVSGPLLFTGGLLDGRARLALWALAALIDLAGPSVLRAKLAAVVYHPGHLPERFGLLLLVALGESIVDSGAPVAAAQSLTGAELAAVTAAFTISCALWWLYFVHAGEAMRYAVTVARSRRDVVRLVYSYGHLSLVAGVIAVATGFNETVARPGRALDPGTLGLLYGGCALFLLTFSYTRWIMFRTVAWLRLGTVLVQLLLLPVVLGLPALGTLAVLAGLLVLLNLLEFRWLRRVREADEAARAGVVGVAV